MFIASIAFRVSFLLTALSVDVSFVPYSETSLFETIVVGARDSYEARCRDCHQAGTDAVQLVA